MKECKIFINGRLANYINRSDIKSIIIEVDDEIVFDRCESQETKSDTSFIQTVSDSSPDTLPKFKAKERIIKHEKRK